jgi:hypothetical protein
MALVGTDNAIQYTTAIGSVLNVGPYSVSANSVIELTCFYERDSGNSPWSPQDCVITDDAGGLTWTRQTYALHGGTYAPALVMWTAPWAAGGTITVTITKATGDADYQRIAGHLHSDTGAHATPVGGTLTNILGALDGSVSDVLSATPETTSRIIAAIGAATSAAGIAITPGTSGGYTELREREDTGPEYVFEVQERFNGSTSTTVVWDDVLTGAGAYFTAHTIFVAMEIKAAAGGGGGGPVPIARRIFVMP